MRTGKFVGEKIIPEGGDEADEIPLPAIIAIALSNACGRRGRVGLRLLQCQEWGTTNILDDPVVAYLLFGQIDSHKLGYLSFGVDKEFATGPSGRPDSHLAKNNQERTR